MPGPSYRAETRAIVAEIADVRAPRAGCDARLDGFALAKLGGEVSDKDKLFYEGKVAAAKFFAQTNLPRLTAERAIAEVTDLALMDLDEAAF